MKLEEKTIFPQLFCLITHLVISSCGACCIRNRRTNYKVLVICKKIFQSSSEVNMRLSQSNQGSIFQIYRLSGSTADDCSLISSPDKLRSVFLHRMRTECGFCSSSQTFERGWAITAGETCFSVHTGGAWLLFKDTLEKTVNPSRQSAAVILTAAATPGENCRGSRERKWWNLAFGCWWEQDRFFINITRLPESAQKKQTYLSRVYSVNLYLSVHEQNAMTTLFLVFFHPFYIISSQLPLKK